MPDYADLNSRALTTEEAEMLAQAFGYAARRCREAGADCVELHGHEGYLLDQFMTGLWNRRDDRYGGSREKRLTFAREAIQAIKRDAGADFPIIYRFGIKHHLDGGREEEEGLWIAGELEKMGVDALHVDAGCYETGWWPHPPQYQPAGCMVELAAKVKAVSKLPVITVGRLQYPDVAEQARAQFAKALRDLRLEHRVVVGDRGLRDVLRAVAGRPAAEVQQVLEEVLGAVKVMGMAIVIEDSGGPMGIFGDEHAAHGAGVLGAGIG